jgi:alpha-1,2-mannosyltransferase
MLAVPVIQKDLLYGQLNGILLLLIVVGWRWLRRGSDIASGLSLGLATALRLYPAFLLLPLLMMRRFRAAAALAMTSAAATLIGSLALGLDDSTRFVRTVAGENFRFWRSAPMNISLVSLPFRWLTRSFWRPDAPDLSRVASLLALVLVVLVVVIALRSRGAFSGDRFLAAIPWMLLATPLSWEFSLVLAMPVVLAGFIRRRGAIRPLPALGSALVLVGIPLGLQGPAPGTPPAVQIFGYALPMYGLLILGLTEVQRDANAISVAVDAARLAAAEQ